MYEGQERRKSGCNGSRCEDVIRLDEQVRGILMLAETVRKTQEQITELTHEQKETNRNLGNICVRLNKGDETINKVKDFDWFIVKANTVRDYAVWILLTVFIVGAAACVAGYERVVKAVKMWVG